MKAYDYIKKPFISEKSAILKDTTGQYSFEVDVRATKTEIKKAVSHLFDVKVKSVRTLIAPGKVKRRGSKLSTAKRTKKAIVTLAADQKISIFEEV